MLSHQARVGGRGWPTASNENCGTVGYTSHGTGNQPSNASIQQRLHRALCVFNPVPTSVIYLRMHLFHATHQTSFVNLLIPVRFEVFTTVTMKNVVFWDIKTQFVRHRRHITSPLHSPAS
jgi:hypothetical protein